MSLKPFFWISLLSLALVLTVAADTAQAAQVSRRTSSSRTVSSSTATRFSLGRRSRHVTPYVAIPVLPKKSARARAIATAREMADTVVPRYRVDASGDLVPDLRAAAAVIYNPATNEVLWEENSTSQRSIASITKVMTATVFLEGNPDLSEPVTMSKSDMFRASTTHLRLNDRVTADDLLHLLLIASDNAAARALARISPFGSSGFVQRMNDKAHELGLEQTHYADPSGLLSDNVSSALDMARLIAHASADERISAIMRKAEAVVRTPRRVITFRSTNHLLKRDNLDVRAGKTGFISRAGYCLATLLRLPQGGPDVAVVVLGARSNAGRFMEAQNLFSWLSSKAPTIFATKAPLAPLVQP